MNMHERFAGSDANLRGARVSLQALSCRSLRIRLATWTKTSADYFAAVAAYEGLSRLSDLQLKQRGLSRDILARDLAAWRDQGPGD
jgi:hypothetical protein